MVLKIENPYMQHEYTTPPSYKNPIPSVHSVLRESLGFTEAFTPREVVI